MLVMKALSLGLVKGNVHLGYSRAVFVIFILSI